MNEPGPMPPKTKYLVEDHDRHGNVRFYVRKPGRAKIRLWPDPLSEEAAFWAAYSAALEGRSLPRPGAKAAPSPAKIGTFRWLAQEYFASADYKRLDESTRAKRRAILEQCCDEPIEPDSAILTADCPINRMGQKQIRMLRDRKLSAPEAANGRLKAIRALYRWALADQDLVKRYGLEGNPVDSVTAFKNATDGHHTWTLEEVKKFEERHPEGTTARRALHLLLFTGTRKSDVIKLGRQHLKTEIDPETEEATVWLSFLVSKNQKNQPKQLQLPVLPELLPVIEATPAGHLTFLINEWGRPFTLGGFGNRMRKWCDQAKLPHCSSHGLRKAGATIAAENGASEMQLNAIFGWDGMKTAAIYTKKARQKRMAGESMHLIRPKEKRAASK